MNCTVFFAFLVADISALLIPGTISNTVDLTDERLVSNSIAKSIEAATQSTMDAGLYPLSINNRQVAKSLPVAALTSIWSRQGKDYSSKAQVHNFIGSTVPNTIKTHNAEVNELLEVVLMDFITTNLP